MDARNPTSKAWLAYSFSLGGSLLDAQDEEAVILAFMKTGVAVLQAEGGTFVPFNEWQYSYSRLKYGIVPSDSQAWLERTVSPATRQACKACQHKRSDEECILLRDTHSHLDNVYCVPVICAGQKIGIVSYFFDSNPQFDPETEAFVSDMVRMVDRALEAVRARSQEKEAWRLVQKSLSSNESLSTLLTSLAEEIRLALGVRIAFFYVPRKNGQSDFLLAQSIASVDISHAALYEPCALDAIWQKVTCNHHQASPDGVLLAVGLDVGRENILALPAVWRGGDLKGMLVLGGALGHTYTEKQIRLLQTVASQAALLIQNDSVISQLEYRAVVGERKRLSREIHDGLAQTLAFLKLETLRMQSSIAKGEMDELSKTLKACNQTLSDAYLEARQVIDNLRRGPEQEFNEWLKTAADNFQLSTGIKVDLNLLPFPLIFSLMERAQLIRIVQEALTNVRKHSGACRVTVSAVETAGDVIVEIRDNGCGFSFDDVRPISQYGLQTMRERSDSIGAEFQIASKPGEGTIVRIQIPSKETETR